MKRTIAVLLLAQLPAAGGPPSAQAAPLDLARYAQLVSDYLDGQPDRAVAELASRQPHTPQQMRTMLEKDWSLDPVKNLTAKRAAAMLEAEAGFASGSLTVLRTRLGHARSWIHSAKPTLRMEEDTFRPLWYIAVGRKSLWQAIAGASDEMLKIACETYPDNASLFLVYGAARELTARAEDGARAVAALAAGSPSRYVPWWQPERRDGLVDARNAFRRALALQPGLVEAQVRLASVLVALNDDGAAAPLLENVLNGAPSPPYGYVAALTLGDIRARNGQQESAIELYLKARTFVPGAQSPYIAHARTLRASGAHDAAAAVIAEMLARPSSAADPWTRYPMGFDAEAADISRLRPLLKGPR